MGAARGERVLCTHPNPTPMRQGRTRGLISSASGQPKGIHFGFREKLLISVCGKTFRQNWSVWTKGSFCRKNSFWPKIPIFRRKVPSFGSIFVSVCFWPKLLPARSPLSVDHYSYRLPHPLALVGLRGCARRILTPIKYGDQGNQMIFSMNSKNVHKHVLSSNRQEELVT